MRPSKDFNVELEKIKMNDLVDECMSHLNDALNICYDMNEIVENRNKTMSPFSETWKAINDTIAVINFLMQQSMPSITEQIKESPPNSQIYK